MSLTERELLYGWLKESLSVREIARRLGRKHTSLLRELKRNRVGTLKKRREYFNQAYVPALADEKAKKRSLKQRTKAPLKEPLIFLYVREHLVYPYFWSPDEVAKRLSIDIPDKSISVETIYQYIYGKGRKYKLWQYLTERRKKRRKQNGRSVKRDGSISGSISIDLRPEIVSSRSRAGDWESDNMLGKQTDHTALSVSVERLARYTILTKLSDKGAVSKGESLINRLGNFPEGFRKTITFDNGKENSEYQLISSSLKLDSYFCHAYHSWEKPTVENTIKRIRRFIPKGESLDNLPEDTVKQIEWILNNTPRKCLGYLTPQEKMLELLQSGTT